MKRLQIMIDEDLDAELEREAAATGTSKAGLIRTYVRERLRPLPPPVPERYRVEPEVVEVPVEPGQEQVSIEGGAPAMVGQPEQGSSDEDDPAGATDRAAARDQAR